MQQESDEPLGKGGKSPKRSNRGREKEGNKEKKVGEALCGFGKKTEAGREKERERGCEGDKV